MDLFDVMDWDVIGGILVKTICRYNKLTTLEERITSLHLFEISLGVYAEFMLCTTVAPILIELLASCVRDSCGYVKLAALKTLRVWAWCTYEVFREYHKEIIPVSRVLLHRMHSLKVLCASL